MAGLSSEDPHEDPAMIRSGAVMSSGSAVRPSTSTIEPSDR